MEVKPASTLSIDQIAALVTTAFAGYDGVGRSYTGGTLAPYLKRHFMPLERGYVFYDYSSSNEPVAFALMAERQDKPGHIRLGSMGALTRRQGHGSRALQIVIEQERARGTQILELECMHNNPAGLALYKRAGFEAMRELPGWETDVVTEYEDDTELEEVGVNEVQRLLKEVGDADTPWQLWDIQSLPFANRGFKLGEAYCVVGQSEEPKKDPEEASTMKLASLFVLPSHRNEGQATRLAKAVMGRFKGSKWFAPAVFPRPFGEGISKKLGARELETRLVQMRLRL